LDRKVEQGFCEMGQGLSQSVAGLLQDGAQDGILFLGRGAFGRDCVPA